MRIERRTVTPNREEIRDEPRGSRRRQTAEGGALATDGLRIADGPTDERRVGNPRGALVADSRASVRDHARIGSRSVDGPAAAERLANHEYLD